MGCGQDIRYGGIAMVWGCGHGIRYLSTGVEGVITTLKVDDGGRVIGWILVSVWFVRERHLKMYLLYMVYYQQKKTLTRLCTIIC